MGWGRRGMRALDSVRRKDEEEGTYAVKTVELYRPFSDAFPPQIQFNIRRPSSYLLIPDVPQENKTFRKIRRTYCGTQISI